MPTTQDHREGIVGEDSENDFIIRCDATLYPVVKTLKKKDVIKRVRDESLYMVVTVTEMSPMLNITRLRVRSTK